MLVLPLLPEEESLGNESLTKATNIKQDWMTPRFVVSHAQDTIDSIVIHNVSEAK